MPCAANLGEHGVLFGVDHVFRVAMFFLGYVEIYIYIHTYIYIYICRYIYIYVFILGGAYNGQANMQLKIVQRTL